MRVVPDYKVRELRADLVKQHAVLWLHHYPNALEAEILKALEDAAVAQGHTEVLKEILGKAENSNPQPESLVDFFTSEVPLEK